MRIKDMRRVLLVTSIFPKRTYLTTPVFNFDRLIRRWLVVPGRGWLQDQTVHRGEDEDTARETGHGDDLGVITMITFRVSIVNAGK